MPEIPHTQPRVVPASPHQFITFILGAAEFAISILSVRGIHRTMPVTPVPQSPLFVEGVINLRGVIIPVIDLRRRFGLATAPPGPDSRMIVIEAGGRTLGLTVDRATGVQHLDGSAIEQPPAMACGVDSQYLRGVGKLDHRLLMLLDLEKLFPTATRAAA